MNLLRYNIVNPQRLNIIVYVIEHRGKIYIPSGYMTTTWGKNWKQWPIQAEKDNRAILRVDGKLCKRQLHRNKYRFLGGIEDVESGNLWLFEMTPAA